MHEGTFNARKNRQAMTMFHIAKRKLNKYLHFIANITLNRGGINEWEEKSIA